MILSHPRAHVRTKYAHYECANVLIAGSDVHISWTGLVWSPNEGSFKTKNHTETVPLKDIRSITPLTSA